MFVVTLTNNGVPFWLRGTTWAFHADRADQFETVVDAQAALDKAAKFMKRSMVKLARIERE